VGAGLRSPERDTMGTDDKKAQRLVAICMLGFLLFNYPILALFNKPTLFLGIPLIYAYIFAAWGLLVAGMAWFVASDGS
jgi:hypothetical protein